MYFKCKSCGSNDYMVKQDSIICKHCGSSYLLAHDRVKQSKKEQNPIKYPLIFFAVVIILFIALQAYEMTAASEQTEETKHPKQVRTVNKQSIVSVNNTNAQIGTQKININTKEDKRSKTISGKKVQHTKIKNDKNTDNSVGYIKDENGNIRHTVYMPRPKILYDSKGNMLKVDNKNLNFTDQKVERYRNKDGLMTTVVTTSGINKKKNTFYLDKKGVIPLMGQTELPGGIVTDVKISNDGNTLFYISRYDDLFIVDISKIEKPKVLSKISISNMSDILLSKDEKKLYVNGTEALAIYDISNKKSPKKLGSTSSGEYYKGMVLSPKEDELYIVKNYHKKHNKLAILDISDPHHPKEKSDILFRATVWSPFVNGSKIYIRHDVSDKYFSILETDSLSTKRVDTPTGGTHNIISFNNYILTLNVLGDIILYQDKNGDIKKLNHLNIEAAWHRFYGWNRDMQFTKNGQYVVFITGKNSISFKKVELILPEHMVDRDTLHNKVDYFGYRYSAIVQPNIDKIKKILLSQDGRRLFALSSSDLFVYDISKLK